MEYREYKVEIPLPDVQEYEDMPEYQQKRLKELQLKLNQYTAMLHTFKKNYHGVIYKNSHNDYDKI